MFVIGTKEGAKLTRSNRYRALRDLNHTDDRIIVVEVTGGASESIAKTLPRAGLRAELYVVEAFEKTHAEVERGALSRGSCRSDKDNIEVRYPLEDQLVLPNFALECASDRTHSGPKVEGVRGFGRFRVVEIGF